MLIWPRFPGVKGNNMDICLKPRKPAGYVAQILQNGVWRTLPRITGETEEQAQANLSRWLQNCGFDGTQKTRISTNYK